MIAGISLARRAVGAALAATLLTVAGCGGAPASKAPAKTPAASGTTAGAAPAAAAKSVTKVSFMLPWLWDGYDSGFVVAKQKGWFKQAGMDVTFLASTSSTVTAEAVASHKVTFGFADAGNVATLISKGAPIKVLGSLVQVTPVGLVFNPPYAPKGIASLKGRTILANSAGGPVNQLLDASLAHGGLTPSAVKKVIVAAQAEASEFAAHPAWYETTLVNSAYPAILKLDPKARFRSYATFGVNTLSLGLIARNSTIQRDPALVRKLVATAMRGWEWAQAHPTQAIDTLAGYVKTPLPPKPVLAKEWAFTIPLEHTAATKGKPLGWMSASDWKETLSVLHAYAGMKKVLPLSTYYTNSFLPAPAA